LINTKCILLLVILFCLGGCGTSHPPLAGRKWADIVRAPDAKLRRKAAFTLGNIGPSDPAVIPALMGALQDRDAAVRCEAVLALLKCGVEAKPAVPVLTQLGQRDPDPKVRSYAVRAAERLQGT
jgi:HEAT repeat protein